jgi:hypothetical protein
MEYEGTTTWTLVEEAIDKLVLNGDLVEKTNRNYITGYLCQILHNGGAGW